jgi:hypothetical protein
MISGSTLFCDITQRIVVVPDERFGKMYGSHLQVSRTSYISWPLKMRPIVCPETPLRNFHYSLCNTFRRAQISLLRVGILKSHLNFLYRFSKNTHILTEMKIHPVGADLFHSDRHTLGRTQRQTDGSTCRSYFFLSQFRKFAYNMHFYLVGNSRGIISYLICSFWFFLLIF